jgi:hypothetical protein
MNGTIRQKNILVTIQEMMMTKRLLQKMEEKRKRGLEYGWLYPNEALDILKDFSPSSVRSFIKKLKALKVIEYLPYFTGRSWGSLFRFTVNGENRLKTELEELNNY